jgi:hypothetical protein
MARRETLAKAGLSGPTDGVPLHRLRAPEHHKCSVFVLLRW